MTYFVVTADPTSSTFHVQPFHDEDTAMDMLFRAEREHAHDRIEVVLLVAEEEEDLQSTHARIFKTLGQLLEPA